MTISPTCPQCGNTLPADAVAELCPRCLIRVFAAPPDRNQEPQPPLRHENGTATDRPRLAGAELCIGPYRLLKRIAEGGMGTVYLAEQTQPVRRRVALKILKPGMDSRQVIARFEAERQALALMDHPNIAKVFDAGAVGDEDTESQLATRNSQMRAGRPYFAMELVQGEPITRYCDRGQIPLRERIELMIPVCEAIQHAHQKGIIHRDIKPSNVLVAEYDGRPVAKVIDFGVAKAIGTRLTEETVFTEVGQIVGTIDYMSPEQARLNAIDIDTRTDVYSLGVLLYELLTGNTPFDKRRFREAALDEVLRIIREEEPTRPSTRVTQLQTGRESQSQIQNRKSRIANDLDWVVMKCLEKQRDRRYESAGSLARDLDRFLRDEPVIASPPSAGYRLRKFVRRNQAPLAVAALVLLFLVALAGSVGWAMRDRAIRQVVLDERITRALADAEEFHQAGRFPDALAAVRRGEDLLASGDSRFELHARVARRRADLELVARLEAIRLEKTAVRDDRFDNESADDAYRNAFAQYGLDLDEMDPDIAGERIRVSTVKADLIAALDDWIATRVSGPLPGHETLISVARRADADPWRDRLREAAQQEDWQAIQALAREPAALTQPPSTILLMTTVLIHRCRDASLGVELLRQAQRRHPDDFWINETLGLQLLESLPAEAVGFFRAALARRPDSPGARLNLGSAQRLLGEIPHAEAEFREAIRLMPEFGMAHRALGEALLAGDDSAAAIANLRTAVHLRSNDDVSHGFLGLAWLRQGRWHEAEAALREALRLNPTNASAHSNLGLVLTNTDRPVEAEAAFLESIRLDPKSSIPHANLGGLYLDRQQYPQAESALRESLRQNPDQRLLHQELGGLLLWQGRSAEAELSYLEALRRDPANPLILHGLGRSLLEQGRLSEADIRFRDAIRLAPDLAEGHRGLGLVLAAWGRFDDAHSTLRHALQLDPENRDVQAALQNLTNLGNLTAVLREQHEQASARPQDAAAYYALANTHARLAQWEPARQAIARALELDPSDHFHWYRSAALHVEVNDLKGYRQVCREMLERFSTTTQPEISERIAQTCMLRPNTIDDFARVLALADQALQGTDQHQFRWYFMLRKGLAEYRADRPAEALKWLQGCAPPRGLGSHDVTALSILAMIQQRLGHSDEARATLARARAITARCPAPERGQPFGDDWHDWLHARIFIQEAGDLIDPPARSTP